MAYPPTAEQWWSLFNYFSTLAVIIGAIVITFLVTAAVKYRSRPGRPEPEDTPKPGANPKDRGDPKYLLLLSAITLTIIATLVIGTLSAFSFLITPPEDDFEIQVTGLQWAWRFEYPNGVQTVGEAVIPVDTPITFRVTSSDVKHKFGIPYFKTGADAIPGHVNTIWIESASTGEHDILCYELCGVGHANMLAKLRIVSQTEFDQWLENIAGQ